MNHLYLLTGYGRPAADGYRRIVEPIESVFEVVVHDDFLYGNHSVARPPIGVAECVARTLELVRDRQSPEESSLIVGHSTGGLVGMLLGCHGWTPSGVFAMSPLRSVPYGWLGFVRRGMWMNVRHLAGRSGDPARSRRLALDTGLAYAANALRKPGALRECLRDFASFDDERALRACLTPKVYPVEVLVCQGDEFFEYPLDLEARLARVFPAVEVRWLAGARSHEACLLNPEQASHHLERFIEDRLLWKRRR